MWEWLCKFFSWESTEDFHRRVTDTSYAEGVRLIDGMRVQTGDVGALRFEIPKQKVKEVWASIQGLDGGPMIQGMRDQLEELGYPEPDFFSDAYSAIHEYYASYSRKPTCRAERTRKFYRLVTRAPLLDSETFVREFREVFSDAEGDEPKFRTSLYAMRKETEWIAGQQAEFEQYNKFANPRPRTMEAFLTARGNTVNN